MVPVLVLVALVLMLVLVDNCFRSMTGLGYKSTKTMVTVFRWTEKHDCYGSRPFLRNKASVYHHEPYHSYFLKQYTVFVLIFLPTYLILFFPTHTS